MVDRALEGSTQPVAEHGGRRHPRGHQHSARMAARENSAGSRRKGEDCP